MSSSRCTVAAVTGASTHWPLVSVAGGGDAQRVGPEVAVEDHDGDLDPLGLVLRVRIPFGTMTPPLDRSAPRARGERFQRGAHR